MKLTERERVLLYYLDKPTKTNTMKNNIIDPDDIDALEDAIDQQEQDKLDDRSWADESHPNSDLTNNLEEK